jgi:hypothetical protein
MRKSIEKERSDVPEPSGVTLGALRIEALPWGKARGLGQNGGYIAAYDAATGNELWTLKVYTVEYDPRKEEDKQDVFIESLAEQNGQLRVTDERGRTYLVDVQSRAVVPGGGH